MTSVFLLLLVSAAESPNRVELFKGCDGSVSVDRAIDTLVDGLERSGYAVEPPPGVGKLTRRDACDVNQAALEARYDEADQAFLRLQLDDARELLDALIQRLYRSGDPAQLGNLFPRSLALAAWVAHEKGDHGARLERLTQLVSGFPGWKKTVAPDLSPKFLREVNTVLERIESADRARIAVPQGFAVSDRAGHQCSGPCELETASGRVWLIADRGDARWSGWVNTEAGPAQPLDTVIVMNRPHRDWNEVACEALRLEPTEGAIRVVVVPTGGEDSVTVFVQGSESQCARVDGVLAAEALPKTLAVFPRTASRARVSDDGSVLSKWWFWSAVGVAVGAAGVTTWALTRDDSYTVRITRDP